MKSQAFRGKDHVMHEQDCSKFVEDQMGEWEDILEEIRDCFVTGKWTESEDAEILLSRDDQDEGIFLYYYKMESSVTHENRN